MAGAAMTTSGNIVAQDISQDTIQFRKKLPVAIDGKLAIPAAIKDVNPDLDDSKNKVAIAARYTKHEQAFSAVQP
jgi:hypothetical protein